MKSLKIFSSAIFLLSLVSSVKSVEIEFQLVDNGFLKVVDDKRKAFICDRCANYGLVFPGNSSGGAAVDIDIRGEIAILKDGKGVVSKLEDIFSDPVLEKVPPVSVLSKVPVAIGSYDADPVSPKKIEMGSDEIAARVNNSVTHSVGTAIQTGAQYGLLGAAVGAIVGGLGGALIPSGYGGSAKVDKISVAEFIPGQIWIRLHAYLPNGETPTLLVMSGAKYEPIDPKELVRVTLDKLGQYLRSHHRHASDE